MGEDSERKDDEDENEKPIDFTTSRAASVIGIKCPKCGITFNSDSEFINHVPYCNA